MKQFISKLSLTKKLIILAVFLVLVSALIVSSAFSGLIASAAETKEWKFLADYTSRDEAVAAAEAVEIEMNEEGMILLKNLNNALPISKSSKITIFGEDGADYQTALIEGGFTGVNSELLSSAGVTTATYGVDSITKYQELSLDFYGDVGIVSIDRDSISEGTDAKEQWTYAADEIFLPGGQFGHQSLVTKTTGTGASTATTVYQHQLMPTSTELELVKYATKHCRKVIIVVGASNTMELEAFEENDSVDGIIWAGQYGDNGLKALPRLLSGEVNPSAKTSDFFEADFTADPTWYNYGDYSQIIESDDYLAGVDNTHTALAKNHLYEKNGTDWSVHVWQHAASGGGWGGGTTVKTNGYPVVMYEEGIYMGYKYWETAYADGFITDWDKAVTYPFGYGLSYTDFEWDIVDVDDTVWQTWAQQTAVSGVYVPTWTERNQDWVIDAKIKVTNTGNVAGKDVVEVYTHAPYITGGVDKAEVSLTAFEKTRLLNPGESEILKIRINIQDMASFDDKDKNGNGYTVYELDANDGLAAFNGLSADYELRFQRDSHDKVLTHTLDALQVDIALDKDDYSGKEIDNWLSQDNVYNTMGWDFKYSEAGADSSDPDDFETLEDRGDMVQLSRDDYAGTHPANTPLYQENMRRSDEYFYFIESWQGYDACLGGWGGEDEAYYNEDYGNGVTGSSTSLYNTSNDTGLVAPGFGHAEAWHMTKANFDSTTNPRGNSGIAWTQVENDGATGKSWDDSKDVQKEGATLPTIMWRDMLGIALWGSEGDATYTYDANATENSESAHKTKIQAFNGKTGWECWSIFMNQLEYDTLKHVVSYCGYTTDVSNIRKPATMDADGPRHWPDTGYDWGSQPTMAATWNYDLVYKIGVMYGNLGRWSDMDVWQGPGANLHRSHFLGRFDDYMSSDGYHGGAMNAAIVSGAESRGALTCMKHGILNDQETDRQGVRTYVSEQAAREGAFKIYQMGMQEGGGGQMMNSLACVGEIDASINMVYIDKIIYGEWDWDGFIVTDGYSGASSYLPIDGLIRSYVLPMGHENAMDNKQHHLSGAWYGDGVYTSKVTELLQYPDEKPVDAVKNYNQWYYTRIQAMRLLYRQLYSSISANGIDNFDNTAGSGMGLRYEIPYEADYLALGKSASLTAVQNKSTSIDISVPEYENMCAYLVNYKVSTEGAGPLPAGLTLSSSGVISGTPTESGTFTFTVAASIDNARKLTGEMDFTLVVSSAWSCDEDLVDDLAAAKVGVAFSGYGMIKYEGESVTSSGSFPGQSSSSTKKYTYKVADSSRLPDGLTLATDGTITGTPTESGYFSVVIDAWTTETVYSVQFAGSYTVPVLETSYTLGIYVKDATGQYKIENDNLLYSIDGVEWVIVTPIADIKGDTGAAGATGATGATGAKGDDAEGGCNSAIGGGIAIALLAIVGAAAIVLLKRKKKENE